MQDDSAFSHLYRIAEFRLVKLCNWQRCLTFKSAYYQKHKGALWAWVRKVLWRKMSERSEAESALSGKSCFTVYDKCATRCTAIVWWWWKHIFSFQRWEQWSVPRHGEVWGKLFEELQYVPPPQMRGDWEMVAGSCERGDRQSRNWEDQQMKRRERWAEPYTPPPTNKLS